jgi:hypothetical protein
MHEQSEKIWTDYILAAIGLGRAASRTHSQNLLFRSPVIQPQSGKWRTELASFGRATEGHLQRRLDFARERPVRVIELSSEIESGGACVRSWGAELISRTT